MRGLNDFPGLRALAICAGLTACDPALEPHVSDASDTISPGVDLAIDDNGGGAESLEYLEYEDAEDLRILNDASNLRPPNITHAEYRRSLQQMAREELAEELPGIVFLPVTTRSCWQYVGLCKEMES
jgi:hypothetical protein